MVVESEETLTPKEGEPFLPSRKVHRHAHSYANVTRTVRGFYNEAHYHMDAIRCTNTRERDFETK